MMSTQHMPDPTPRALQVNLTPKTAGMALSSGPRLCPLGTEGGILAFAPTLSPNVILGSDPGITF